MIYPRIEPPSNEDRFAERLSRRSFIGRAGSAALALSLLAACRDVDDDAEKSVLQRPKAASVSHSRTEIRSWTFANWPLYIDKEVIKDFNREFGGKCKYVEEIDDNTKFFRKVRHQLQSRHSIGRDIVTLTDYMASRWVRLNYCEPIDKKNVPNLANLVDNLRTINYDPKREFTMPWQSGAIGLGYNPKKTGREIKSINDLFDPEFKGRVTLFADPYDTASTVLLGDGLDASNATIDQLLGAIEKLDKANQAGQFRRFTGNDYTTDLRNGDVWIALAYSGDLVQLQSQNPELRFAYPDEGAMLFTDNMMMPARVQHAYAAETMMNYVYEPEVAAKIAAHVNYISPVKGIEEILAADKRTAELVDSPLMFPPDDIRARLKPYPTLSPEDETTMHAAMAKVTGT